MEKQIGEVLQKMEMIDSNHNNSMFYEYILTSDEEKRIIHFELERIIGRTANKLSNYGYTKLSIEKKLNEIDFKAQIDEFKLLSDANVRKHWEIERQESDKRRKANEQKIANDVKAKCNANYFFRLIKHSFEAENKIFIQDEFSNPYIKIVCFFMSEDPRFETELGFDFKKGLWIIGPTGIGKTRIFEAVSENELSPIQIVSMLTIADKVQSDGEFKLNNINYKKLLLDDVGSEQPLVKHFGTPINWFKEFVELYYSNRRHFNKLLVTSNNDFDEIEEKYGKRARSRIREMFNIAILDGKDRRK